MMENETVIFWAVIVPIVISVITFIGFFIGYFIPFLIDKAREDYAWNSYNSAYHKWVANGKVGKMPVYDDYKNRK